MAAFAETAVKLVGVAAALPFVTVAAGFRLRFVQAKETGDSGARVYRVCDLPAYTVPDMGDLRSHCSVPYPRNSLEAGIGVVRRTAQRFCEKFLEVADNSLQTTVKTSVSTSVATYRYLRNNTEDFSLAVLVAGAGAGGFLLAHRSNPRRRLLYVFLAAVPCAALCYPSKLKQVYQLFSEALRDTWEKKLQNHLEEKYNLHQGQQEQWEQSQVLKAPRLYTGENFDTISLSDFYEPDVEKWRTVDLCRADNVEKPCTANLCHTNNAEKLNTAEMDHAESAENVNTVCYQEDKLQKPCTANLCYTNNVEKLNTAQMGHADSAENVNTVCYQAYKLEKPCTETPCHIENAENITTVVRCQADDFEKLSTGGICTTEHVEKLSRIDFYAGEPLEKLDTCDVGNAEITEKSAPVDYSQAENIDKPNSVSENSEKLSIENGTEENREKHWSVENYNFKETEENTKISTDQSNPDDKDMYSTRSS